MVAADCGANSKPNKTPRAFLAPGLLAVCRPYPVFYCAHATQECVPSNTLHAACPLRNHMHLHQL